MIPNTLTEEKRKSDEYFFIRKALALLALRESYPKHSQTLLSRLFTLQKRMGILMGEPLCPIPDVSF
jgi:3-methyladenine DNA glycosylase AlkD